MHSALPPWSSALQRPKHRGEVCIHACSSAYGDRRDSRRSASSRYPRNRTVLRGRPGASDWRAAGHKSRAAFATIQGSALSSSSTALPYRRSSGFATLASAASSVTAIPTNTGCSFFARRRPRQLHRGAPGKDEPTVLAASALIHVNAGDVGAAVVRAAQRPLKLARIGRSAARPCRAAGSPRPPRRQRHPRVPGAPADDRAALGDSA